MWRPLQLPILCMVCVSCGDSPPAEPPPLLGESATGRVVARISGLRNGQGQVIARLYRGGGGFPSDAKAAYREREFAIADGVSVVSFDAVPYGEYAIWICHDEDGDGELNTNLLGMPKEGVGVSGPPPSFIPTYRSACFTLESGLSEHKIVVKYL